jgi:uncharacterized membrane protein
MTIIIGLLSAFAGFFIAFYIFWKQEIHKPLFCPRKSPCETVITSPQAKTAGIANTLLGMMYYGVVFFLLAFRGMGGESLSIDLPLLLLTTAGFLFSGYLVWLQYSLIKQWCIWCLGSAATATILFVIGLLLFL